MPFSPSDDYHLEHRFNPPPMSTAEADRCPAPDHTFPVEQINFVKP
jgi:hypothetical protein